MIRGGALLGALVLLSGCGDADTDPGPGGVTVGEARALDQAAEMLDQQRLPDEALDDPAADSDEMTAVPTPVPMPTLVQPPAEAE